MSRAGKASQGAGDRPPVTSLLVHVQPRASRTEIVGWHGDAIKIRVAAPPVDGAANEELLRFLARRLAVSATRVRMAAGSTGRRKRIEITGVEPVQLAGMLGVGSKRRS